MIRQTIRLGDLLVEKGLIADEELHHALRMQKESNFSKKLGEILIDEGFVTEREIAEQLAEQLHLEFIDLRGGTRFQTAWTVSDTGTEKCVGRAIQRG